MAGFWNLGKWPMLVMTLHIIGIVIFVRGFLLTRTELPHHSHSSDVHRSPCFPSQDPHTNRTCWTKPVVDRLVIIVLDALRFDFVAPSSFFKERKPWMDRLPVLQKMAVNHSSSARIFKAIADPPTTSLQRLKGLTTGALPTFIDIGNSFGAPAIAEDNFIHQLVQSGKRVVMMGDDTWTQLFPDHFNRSYPYPSFNVKDLHTVDNGCIENLLPSLYLEDWDVLIAHFLGVDHAGHIFGVDSTPMIEKLEQYNAVLEKVIDVLQSHSGSGGIHENTLLVVMGDHGQTLHGDHGGGGAEEVETSMFSMSFRDSAHVAHEFDYSTCELDWFEEKKICISNMQQLDFAATVSALLGLPFPFGSIGSVNPELYALVVGTWNLESAKLGKHQSQPGLEELLQNYANVLCINSWQVKRYLDAYSASSVIGFSGEDLLQISDLYAKAEEKWLSNTRNELLDRNESSHASLPYLKLQIRAYLNFLSGVAELARSKWTQFNLKIMIAGFLVMLTSLLIHLFAIERVKRSCGISLISPGASRISLGLSFSFFLVLMRACSFLSNSYILEEGKVANFLLATTGIIKLRYSLMRRRMQLEAIIFSFLIFSLRVAIEIGLSKQAATSQFMDISPSWMVGISLAPSLWRYMAEIFPILALVMLVYLLYNTSSSGSCHLVQMYVIMGTIVSYLLIGLYLVTESHTLNMDFVLKGVGRNFIPRAIYAIGFGQLLLLAFSRLLTKTKFSDHERSLYVNSVAIVSACSSTIILLMGKQGPVVALASVIAGYCIMKLENIGDAISGTAEVSYLDPLSVVQWNLFAVCLFFATGHWCAFDGLHYGAAFIGFDEFILVPQAILLTIDTYGFSHILPVFGLPFVVGSKYLFSQTKEKKIDLHLRVFQGLLMYGHITATTATATVLCVTVHRRHLMVWGLFAPKFVFDVVGLILTDILICLGSVYYLGGVQLDRRLWHMKSIT